jgi:hypothetical protein
MIDRQAWDDYCQQRKTLIAAFRDERAKLDEQTAAKDFERHQPAYDAAWERHGTALKQLREKFGITGPPGAQRTTEYAVSIFTEADDPDGRIGLSSWELKVAYRGRSLWAVVHHSYCLNKSGGWDYEMRPTAREDDWLSEHRFLLLDALRLARAAAPNVTVNGWTAAELKIELFMKGKIE